MLSYAYSITLIYNDIASYYSSQWVPGCVVAVCFHASPTGSVSDGDCCTEYEMRYAYLGLLDTRPGPRLNIKTVLSTYGDFHVKDKTAVRPSYL